MIKDFNEALLRLDILQKQIKRPRNDVEALSLTHAVMPYFGIPVFNRSNQSIHVADENTFDYSVLAEAIASYCIGLDQFLVATDLEKSHHQVFETIALYSSAYQSLDTLLSIMGIHFVPNPFKEPKTYKRNQMQIYNRRADGIKSEKRYLEIPCIMAETTGSSKWIFSISNLSNEVRWERFADLVGAMIELGPSSQIPIAVKNLYGYLKAISDYKQHRFDWKEFRVKIPTDAALKTTVMAYSREIPQMRHEAIYENRSYDVFAYAAEENKQDVQKMLDTRLSFIRAFAVAMSKWVTEPINQIFQNLKRLEPGPTKAIDWVHFVCEYLPLKRKLAQVRFDKLLTNDRVRAIDNKLPDIVADIAASFAFE